MLSAAVPELDFQACQASAVMPQSGALSKAVPGLVCVYAPDEASFIAQTASSMLTHTVGRWQAAHRATHVSEMSGRAPAASQTLMNGASATH